MNDASSARRTVTNPNKQVSKIKLQMTALSSVLELLHDSVGWGPAGYRDGRYIWARCQIIDAGIWYASVLESREGAHVRTI